MINVLGIVLAVALGSAVVTQGAGSKSIPIAGDGLFKLATTGWATGMSGEGKGVSYDKIGGKPGNFEYAKNFDLSSAKALLGDGEFLAPHVLDGFNGKLYIMVAPHIFSDGVLSKGANVNKDHFIIVDKATGSAERFDYSADVA